MALGEIVAAFRRTARVCRTGLLFMALSWGGLSQGRAATVRVGAAPWGDFTAIQDAINAASPGDEIWVQEGVYSLSAQITVDKAVAIYGGFDGTEIDRDERNRNENVTIIDGQLNVRCLYVTADATIDGFTIRNGKDAAQYSDGGGIYVESASPTIANCYLNGNYAAWRGGGVFMNNASPAMTKCSFSNNDSDVRGGAMDIEGSSAPVVTDCVFNENTTYHTGGAIYIGYGGSPTITACQFLRNRTKNVDMGVGNSSGGAIYIDTNSAPQIADSSFAENSVNVYGGAIYSNNWGAAADTIIKRCRFERNSTPFVGGALFIAHGRGKVVNCVFIENEASQAGAMEDYTTSDMEVTNCTFVDNNASRGASVINSDSTIVLTNSILRGAGSQIYNTYSTCTVSYSDVQGSGGSGSWSSAYGTDGGGNIDADPLFRSSSDVHLAAGSPCINAGNPDPALNDPDGTRNDMGAYGGPDGEVAGPPAAPAGLRIRSN